MKIQSEECASGPSTVDDSASDDNLGSIASVIEAVEKTIGTKRKLISKLKGKKNSKLIKKVTTENRMLVLGQEELQLKKRMIDRLEKSEKAEYTESMQRFATRLNSLSSTLQNGFNTPGMMMQRDHNQQYNIKTHSNINCKPTMCQTFGICRILLILIRVEQYVFLLSLQ